MRGSKRNSKREVYTDISHTSDKRSSQINNSVP